MKILVYGDVVGRIGREALARTLSEWKKVHDPDLVIANVENLAHGKGITRDTLDDLLMAGVDFFTSGNHVFDKPEATEIFADPDYRDRIIRPGNYPAGTAGEGAKLLTVGTKTVLVINLLGRVFTKVVVDDPFRSFDDLYAAHVDTRPGRAPNAVLVDFHGDATSEKNAFAWYAAGRATAIWGTHTHVPTRDERIFPGNGGLPAMAYITDVGMTGFRDGVIGVQKEEVLRNFLTQERVRHEIPDEGEAIANAILIETGAGGATSLTHLQKVVHIP